MSDDFPADAELWFGSPDGSIRHAIDAELAGGYRGHSMVYAGSGERWMLTCRTCGAAWILRVESADAVADSVAGAVVDSCRG